jgi:hypothetical protein
MPKMYWCIMFTMVASTSAIAITVVIPSAVRIEAEIPSSSGGVYSGDVVVAPHVQCTIQRTLAKSMFNDTQVGVFLPPCHVPPSLVHRGRSPAAQAGPRETAGQEERGGVGQCVTMYYS